MRLDTLVLYNTQELQHAINSCEGNCISMEDAEIMRAQFAEFNPEYVFTENCEYDIAIYLKYAEKKGTVTVLSQLPIKLDDGLFIVPVISNSTKRRKYCVLEESQLKYLCGEDSGVDSRVDSLEESTKNCASVWKDYLQHLGVRELKDDEKTALLPENKNVSAVDDTTQRFSSAIWFEKMKEHTVTIAGLGGINSWSAPLISRMKPKAIVLYDDDVVETVNMAGQFYSVNDIGRKKVDVIAEKCSEYAMYNNVIAIPERFNDCSEVTNVMISGFDSMASRRVFFERWKKHVALCTDGEKMHCLYIEARLAAEEFQIFCLRGNDDENIKIYDEKYLFSDSNADPTVCSYKQTSYCASMIGSFIANLFVNFVANEVTEGIRDLPFRTSYEADFMMLNILH